MALFGIEPAQSGDIHLNGQPITIKSIQDAVKNGIAYVPEDRLLQGLVMDQSIAANAAICTLDHYLNPIKLLDSGKLRDAVAGYLKGMQVKFDNQSKPIRMLSGGNQQSRVGKMAGNETQSIHPRQPNGRYRCQKAISIRPLGIKLAKGWASFYL
jgi:simple sugar transport system ATP-binding protein